MNRLEALVSRHFDDLLSADERVELERMLLESAKARACFWEMARLNSGLRQWGQEEWGRREGAAVKLHPAPALRLMPQARRPVPKPAPGGRRRPAISVPVSHRTAWWPLAAAAVFAIGFLVWNSLPPPIVPERGVAVLTHASDVVWSPGSSATAPGSVLKPGWLRFESGVVQVEFSRGARVVLEGPAEFRVASDNSGELFRGRISAVVPEPAHGFAVQTSQFTVVDHGTKFGCSVPATGPQEVHVFGGKVGLRQAFSSVENVSLTTNEAVQVNGSEIKSIPVNAALFLDEEELALRDRHGLQERLIAWQGFSRQFSRRKDLLAYLDFQPTEDGVRSLPNRAVKAGPQSFAAIVGSDWVEGRWPGKGALEFKRTDDRVRLKVPGNFASMTFLAWVRVDGLPNRVNALVSGENTERLGETQWYVFEDGSLGVGVRTAARGRYTQWWHSHSPPIFTAGNLGTWTFVATVFDRAAKKVTHFVNGEVVRTGPIDVEPNLELGTMEIGNWGIQQDVPLEVGNFEGRIDEVAVLSSALDAAEIRRAYEAGSPGEVKSPAVATMVKATR